MTNSETTGNAHEHKQVPVWKNKSFLHITILMMIGSVFYYMDVIIDFCGWGNLRWGIFYTVHDLHRALFLIPVMYAAYVFRIKGAVATSLISFIIFLPRALIVSPYPDPLLRAIIFIISMGIIGVLLASLLNNISECKKLEKDLSRAQNDLLRETQEYLDSLIKYANAPIIAWNKERQITIFNAAFERLTGYAASEILGQTINILFPDANRDDSLFRIKQALDGKHWETEEIAILHKKGSIRTVLWNSANIYDKSSKIFLATIAQGQDITERKLSEKALQERDALFARISSQVPGMLYQFARKPDGAYLVPYSNEGVKEIFGCLPQDVHDTFDPIFKVIFPEDRDRLIQTIEESAKNLSPWTCEYRVQLPGKPVKWILGNSIPEKMTDGTIVWSGYNTDITARKIAEEEMLLAHNRLQRLIDSNIVGIIIATAEGEIVEANDYYLSIIGFTREEFEQGAINWRAITPAELLPADENAICEMREKGTCTPYEKEYQRRDGKRISVFLADTILPGPEEQIAAFVLDITERKRAEDQLRESEAKLQLTIDEAPICVAMVGIDKRFLQCNKSFCEFLGYSNEEMKGKTIAEITFPADMEIGMAEMQTVLVGQKTSSTVQKRYVRKDGMVVWGGVSINVIRDNHGSPMYFLPIIQDITERRQAEEKILKLNEDLEQKVIDRTAELRETIAQLEEVNRTFVGRELRMIELKEQIAQLEKQKT